MKQDLHAGLAGNVVGVVEETVVAKDKLAISLNPRKLSNLPKVDLAGCTGTAELIEA